MRQELFLGWSIPFAMLFAFYSCSHEMDSNLESAVEEAVDLRLDQDSALTRSDLWEEEEESALEWAEDREGKCPYSPCGLCEFKFVPDLDSDTEDGYSYYADFVGMRDLLRKAQDRMFLINIFCKFSGAILVI